MIKACKNLLQEYSFRTDSYAYRVLMACWLFAGLLCGCSERSWTQESETHIDSAVRLQVVEAAAKALEDSYIFPDLGVAMANKIRHEYAAHAYDALTTGTDFSRRLTADLYSVGHDKHVHVDPDEMGHTGQEGPGLGKPRLAPGRPGPRPRIMEGPPPVPGVAEFRNLPDDIGYIRIDHMLPAEPGNNTIDTAMAALVGSKALIIDLRHNGGGDPMVVAYLCTYLFPAGAHIRLNDFVSRDDPAPRPSYTLPSMTGKPFLGDVYILTSHFTFSGGEEMAYDLQALKRATIVGETTGGGANPGWPVPLPDKFSIFIPTGRPVNPITKTNWEGVGVHPDVPVPADKALEKAELLGHKGTRI
jgi:hypothetical protein